MYVFHLYKYFLNLLITLEVVLDTLYLQSFAACYSVCWILLESAAFLSSPKGVKELYSEFSINRRKDYLSLTHIKLRNSILSIKCIYRTKLSMLHSLNLYLHPNHSDGGCKRVITIQISILTTNISALYAAIEYRNS